MENDHTKVTVMSAEQQTAIVDTKKVLASKQDALMKLGQVQAFNFIGKLLTVSELKIIQELKESKAYIGLTFKGENSELLTVSTWDECCQQFLGLSRQSVDNRLLNLQQFGDEFFEQANKMQLGHRELRKLRHLPTEDQTLIIESQAIDAGDKEAVKELIEDLSAKHAKEKQQLESKANDSKSLANARQSLIEVANKNLADKTEELEKLRETKQYSPTDWLKQVQEINFLCTKVSGIAIEAVNQLEELTQRILTEELDPNHTDQALEHLAVVHIHGVDQLFVAASRLSTTVRGNFEGYIYKARPMYSEKEILALEAQIIART